jgi:CBS domain-containing protein
VAAIVAMSALFGAAARAPFTAFVFAFELTGDNSAIIPLMIGGVMADVSCRFLLKQSIMTERLARRGLDVSQDYEPDPLRRIRVGSAMTRTVNAIPAGTTIRDLIAKIDAHERGFRHQGYPVVDADGRLYGVVTRSDIAAATIAEPETSDVTIDDPVSAASSTDLEVTYPDVALADALMQMVRRRIGRLPVVDRADQRKLVGWLSRSDVFNARAHAIDDELVRDRRFRASHLWRRRRTRGGTPSVRDPRS